MRSSGRKALPDPLCCWQMGAKKFGYHRALWTFGFRLTTDLSRYACRDVRVALPLWLRWRMSCIGHLAAGRPPVIVRPTSGAVSLQMYGFGTCDIQECMRYATRLVGSGLRTSCLRRVRLLSCRDDHTVSAVLPCDVVGCLSQHFQGLLAFALGLG